MKTTRARVRKRTRWRIEKVMIQDGRTEPIESWNKRR